MRKSNCFVFLFILLSFFCFEVLAGEYCNYTNGSEGIKAATVPPPGFYYRLYNAYYEAHDFVGANRKNAAVDYELRVSAQVHRLVWVKDKKLWGADYVYDMLIPIVYQDVNHDALGIDDSTYGIGDIIIEPFGLAWHNQRFDHALALGWFIPTGKYDRGKAASPGKDRWTTILSAGSTYYFDLDKLWSLSVLARYEIHGEKQSSHVKGGNDFHFEWGLGRTIVKKWIWDVGVAGYSQWQITDDSGSAITYDEKLHDRVHAIGPEVAVFVPTLKSAVSLRALWEYGAIDRPEGNIVTLTITKMF